MKNNNTSFVSRVSLLSFENFATQSHLYQQQNYTTTELPAQCSVCFKDTSEQVTVQCKIPACSRMFHSTCVEVSQQPVVTSVGRSMRRVKADQYQCFHCTICITCGSMLDQYVTNCSSCGFRKCNQCQGIPNITVCFPYLIILAFSLSFFT